MLRTLLILILLAILVAIALVATGYINVNQTRQARSPTIDAGQTPTFDVNVQPLEVGTVTKNVQVPVVEMQTKQIQVPTVHRQAADAGNQQ